MYKSKHGFTIVELLIVIVVIAILAAISVVAYSGIQQRARDSERLQDTASIQKILELYYIDNNSYPVHSNFNNPTWRAANLPPSSVGAFINPQSVNSANSMNAGGSAVNVTGYSYYAVKNNGGSVCRDDEICTGYRLAWRLESNPDTLQYKYTDK